VIESLVEQIEARYADVQEQMADPEVIGDRRRYAEAGRQFNQLAPAAKLAEEWRRAVSDAEGAQELIDEGADDPELRDELRASRERIEELEEEIRLAMVEPDPNDDKNVIVEIRGGAGGDEAGLSTSTAPPAPAASRSTPPTPRSGSRTSRPASSSRCRTRSRSCRTASAR
jgi:peptide chain release factor 1